MFRAIIAATLLTLPALAHAQMPSRAKLVEGHELYLAGNYDGALTTYNEVKKADAKSVVGYYFAACALLALNRHDEASAAIVEAIGKVGDRNESLRAKLLFFSAVIKEHKGDLAAAKKAWDEYIRFAKAHGSARTFISSATARLDAIAKKTKLDEQYRGVKQRIAAAANK